MCLLWHNVYSGPLPIFKLVCLFVCLIEAVDFVNKPRVDFSHGVDSRDQDQRDQAPKRLIKQKAY